MVHEPVRLSRLSTHEVVTVRIAPNRLDILTRVFGQNTVQTRPQVQNLAGVDLNVGRLTLEAAEWLVDRLGRLAPSLHVESRIQAGGGQYLVVLTS